MYFCYFIISSPCKRVGPFIWKKTLTPFTQECFVPSLVEIYLVVLEKKIFKIYLKKYFPVLLSCPIGNGCGPMFEQTWILCTKFSWVVLEKKKKWKVYGNNNDKEVKEQIVIRIAHLSHRLRWPNKIYVVHLTQWLDFLKCQTFATTSATNTSQSSPRLAPFGFPFTPTCTGKNALFYFIVYFCETIPTWYTDLLLWYVTLMKLATLNSYDLTSRAPTHQTMLFAMIQPVPCSACPDDSLKLIGLHPNQLINALVSNDDKSNKIRIISHEKGSIVLSNKRVMGMHCHQSIKDSTLNSCQKGSYLHIKRAIIDFKNETCILHYDPLYNSNQ